MIAVFGNSPLQWNSAALGLDRALLVSKFRDRNSLDARAGEINSVRRG